MELMKIGHNALKVTLSREDMELYDLEFDMLDYANSETRRVIWSILDEAKRSLGFEVARDNLYIQAFRSRCGGCELFVSREEKKETLPKQTLFRFKDTESLIKGCARLKNCGFEGKSSAYIGDSDELYLELTAAENDYIYLDEISRRLPYSKEFLSEHTKLLTNSAVVTLAGLR
ncbi:MAG: adaptor protein MecA [Clostridia bacterium]|nr:adaptor protein MecA [Clostridia bacterium]